MRGRFRSPPMLTVTIPAAAVPATPDMGQVRSVATPPTETVPNTPEAERVSLALTLSTTPDPTLTEMGVVKSHATMGTKLTANPETDMPEMAMEVSWTTELTLVIPGSPVIA